MHLRRDYKVPAWKVAVSTSAAPTYFPCSRNVYDLRLIDGGVWANNPILVATVESIGPLGRPLASMRALSIGTSDDVVMRDSSLDSGGFFQWRQTAVEVILKGQSIGVVNQAGFLLGKENIVRINPPAPPGLLTLDGFTRAEDLIAKCEDLREVGHVL